MTQIEEGREKKKRSPAGLPLHGQRDDHVRLTLAPHSLPPPSPLGPTLTLSPWAIQLKA